MKVKSTPKEGKVLLELDPTDEALLKPLPFRLQRILVPFDFSDTAKEALRYAVPLATAFDAEVVIVYVQQPYSIPSEIGYMPPDLPINQPELADSIRAQLGSLGISEIGTRARYQVKVRLGLPWQEIIFAADELNADLIILSTHGRTGLKHALLGSVAERVVRHAHCPVLVVRERERDFIRNSNKLPAGA